MTDRPDPAEARRRLAAAQTRLLAALLTGEPPPPGFDRVRLRAQADALLAKRREIVARLRPDLVEAAGGQFRARFDSYARTHPRPADGARADADAYANAIAAAPASERQKPATPTIATGTPPEHDGRMTDEVGAGLTMSLGRTDLQVPHLGVGVMVWGDMSAAPRWNPARNSYGPTSTLQEQREALEVSLGAGVNLFDTAAMYGKGVSEQRLGELTEGRNVIVATKFPAGFISRAGSLPATLDASLARLRRPAVDLYQVHFPSRWMSIPRVMNLMADAVDAGKVRAVGVSNYSAAQMRTAHAALAKRGIPLASNQVQYSLLHRDPERDGVLAACRELGVTLIAYMPLASGALTGKYSADHRPAGWRRYMPVFRDVARLGRVNTVLADQARRHGTTPSQVALRWLIQQPNVLPIPGAKNGAQAADNIGALSVRLTDTEMDELSRATATKP